MKTDFDIAIVGAGLVGLTTALACAQSGASVALLDRNPLVPGQDGRASALSTTSLILFENLGVDLSGQLQPIRDMLVTEGAPDSPWRLHFEGDGDGGDLGALIENPALKAALLSRVEASDDITVLAPCDLLETQTQTSGVTLETSQGTLSAKLLVAADGRDSVLRRKAGITVQRFDYDAASLVTTIAHDLPHDGLAWQRFLPGGALAVLPLTGQRSQIVWSAPTARTDAAVALPEDAFLALLSEKMDGYLGEMQLIAPRAHWPLRLQVADGCTADRLALVGDAAHVIHPLAGQGLNLGLRDSAALAEGVANAINTGQDIGIAGLLDYDLWRNSDVRMLGATTHALASLYHFNGTVIGHARRVGLALTNRLPALKSALESRAAGRAHTGSRLLQRGL